MTRPCSLPLSDNSLSFSLRASLNSSGLQRPLQLLSKQRPLTLSFPIHPSKKGSLLLNPCTRSSIPVCSFPSISLSSVSGSEGFGRNGEGFGLRRKASPFRPHLESYNGDVYTELSQDFSKGGDDNVWLLPASFELSLSKMVAALVVVFVLQTVSISTFAGMAKSPQIASPVKALFLMAVEAFGVLSVFATVHLTGLMVNYFQLDIGKWKGRRGWLAAAIVGLILVIGWEVVAERLMGGQDPMVAEARQLLESLLGGGPISVFLTALVCCCLGPLKEEILFRAFLLPCLKQWMPFSISLVVSSILFALAHGSSRLVFVLAPQAMILGSIYAWTGNLMAPLVVHGAVNGLVLAQLSLKRFV